MAARRKKGKGGRPKGLAQSASAIKKIKSGMKAYWASAAGKKRRAAMSKASGGGKKRKTTSRAKKAAPKMAWSRPKVTARRGRPKGSKNKAKATTTKSKAPVASRSKRRKSPMA